MRLFLALAPAIALTSPVQAQSFTTAKEVRPILELTRPQWIGVREWEGQDLLYFTHLESWRCGLQSVEFGMNGDDPTQQYQLGSCDETSANPNALDLENHLPFIALPAQSIGTVKIRITFDDGTSDEAEFERGSILIP